MRIHTDTLTERDISTALRLLPNVYAFRVTRHGSRSHDHAFEVSSTGSSPRRTQTDRDYYAATWEEWGWFLAEMFKRESGIKAGPYRDSEHFHRETRYQFES